MGKYIINYACGHTGEIQLFGKISERERKVEWLESQLCPECAKKEYMAKVMADETPVTIKVSLATANLSNNNKIIINAIAEGGTYKEKENLKALGFRFGELPMTGLFGLFDHPQKGWYKIIEVATLDDIASALKFGNYKIISGITGIDIAAMRDRLAAIDASNKAKAAQKTEIGKSPVQQWVEQNYKGYWNGKIYDSGAAYGKPARVYISNVEHNIPSEIYDAQIEWRKRRDEIKSVLEGNK